MSSLQDQLLKAGLVDAKTAKKTRKDKSKQAKVARKSKQTTVDESKLAAQQAREAKAERDRELNRQQQEVAQQKAIAAQVRQLIDMNRIDRGEGDIGFNFKDGSKIKKIYVTAPLQDQLSRGRLAIVRQGEGDDARYEIVAAPVANKIAQRDEAVVLFRGEAAADQPDEDDPYADYQIPDDLMW